MEIKGYTYGYGTRRDLYRSDRAKQSQDALMDLGINWVCLAFPMEQETFASTEIKFNFAKSASDLDVIATINRFHEKGVKVCLKPMVNCTDGTWRALINFPDNTMMEKDIYWSKWFESYTAFLTHYAEIAEMTGCEMFCMGCEMLSTERKESYWRNAIEEVKKYYHGPLIYNTNHGCEEDAKWVDALDYLGTSAYYRVAKKPGATKDEMVAAWLPIRDRLAEISKRTGKKIVFMEIGCRSAAGCAMMPWDFTHREFPRSEEEQANFYESCLEVFSKEEWFEGIFWWDWSTVIYDSDEQASQDMGFNIHRKLAEKVVREYYSK